MEKLLILGCGAAGCTLAKKIATNPEKNFDITIVDRSADGFYAKMRLPDALAGKLPLEKLILDTQESLNTLGIHTEFGKEAVELDSRKKTLRLSNGKILSWDIFVFASGADAGLPPIPGAEKDMTLRTLDDLRRILGKIHSAKSAVVIGGGLLGLEVANALFTRGISITVLECMNRLLPRQLNEKESALLRVMFEGKGWKIHTGCAAKIIERGPSHVSILLAGGEESLETDMVLISAGIRPASELAEKAGIAAGRGIPVDARFETRAKDVYAIGDCAEIGGIVRGLWIAARDQASALADILEGKLTGFDNPEYNPSLKIPGIRLDDLRAKAAKP